MPELCQDEARSPLEASIPTITIVPAPSTPHGLPHVTGESSGKLSRLHLMDQLEVRREWRN